jgi:hypothetical protein
MRVLTAALLVCVATLVTLDAFHCPDGCRQAASPDAADQCNASSACILCTGGFAQSAPAASAAPVVVFWANADFTPEPLLLRAVPSVYHPPRIG